MRTNIVIDEKLIEQAMAVSGLKTKKETVNTALAEFVWRHSQKNLLDIAGAIQFADNYDYKTLRGDR